MITGAFHDQDYFNCYSVPVRPLPACCAGSGPVGTKLRFECGNDGNNCGRSTPCRTFQAAHDKTLPGGEMVVLDQGNFATLTITKTISIVNEGIGQASILVGNGDTGLTINAPGAKVNLRGLTIEGVGDSRGVLVGSVLSLTMTNCIVRNHTGDGIDIAPATNSNITISHTLVADNGGNGIFVQPSGTGAVKVVFNHVEVYNSGAHGIAFVGSFLSSIRFDVSVVDSVSAGNNLAGIISDSTNAVITLVVLRSVAANNGTGVATAGSNFSAGLAISQSQVTGNNKGWERIGGLGALISYGDNVWLNHDNDPSLPVPP